MFIIYIYVFLFLSNQIKHEATQRSNENQIPNIFSFPKLRSTGIRHPLTDKLSPFARYVPWNPSTFVSRFCKWFFLLPLMYPPVMYRTGTIGKLAMTARRFVLRALSIRASRPLCSAFHRPPLQQEINRVITGDRRHFAGDSRTVIFSTKRYKRINGSYVIIAKEKFTVSVVRISGVKTQN